jgi:hypothetical protein
MIFARARRASLKAQAEVQGSTSATSYDPLLCSYHVGAWRSELSQYSRRRIPAASETAIETFDECLFPALAWPHCDAPMAPSAVMSKTATRRQLHWPAPRLWHSGEVPFDLPSASAIYSKIGWKRLMPTDAPGRSKAFNGLCKARRSWRVSR